MFNFISSKPFISIYLFYFMSFEKKCFALAKILSQFFDKYFQKKSFVIGAVFLAWPFKFKQLWKLNWMFYVLLSPTFEKSGSDKKVFTRVQKYIFQYTFHDIHTHTCAWEGEEKLIQVCARWSERKISTLKFISVQMYCSVFLWCWWWWWWCTKIIHFLCEKWGINKFK